MCFCRSASWHHKDYVVYIPTLFFLDPPEGTVPTKEGEARMTEAIEFEVEQSDDKYDEEEEFEEEEEGFKTSSPKKRKAAPKTTTPKDVYKKESSRRKEGYAHRRSY
jgi:hypothetical protein